MGMDVYRTIAPREPVAPSEAQLAAFLLDLHRYAIIDERYTLISSPTADVSRSGGYTGHPGAPGEYGRLVRGPEMAAGTVVDGWFSAWDSAEQKPHEYPATVHYDGGDLDRALGALPSARAGTADVFLLTQPGTSMYHLHPDMLRTDHVADAIAVTVLAAPVGYEPANGGCWMPYREEVYASSREEERPWTEADDEAVLDPYGLNDADRSPHPVQWAFDTWANGGGLDHFILPLHVVLHRHLGDDLLEGSCAL